MAAGQMVIILFDLALVFFASRLLGAVARRLDQPAVIGEILGGILIGPTLFHGSIANTLFPADVRPLLSAFANLGVALFMFTVGFELDHKLLRGARRAVIGVSAGSVLPTFGLGALLAWYLTSAHPTGHTAAFVLFMSLAMSVTALPVLARILHDRRMNGTPVGTLAVSSAAVGDAFAWTVLAVVAMLAGKEGEQWRFLLVPLFVGLLLGVRPLFRRLMDRVNASTGHGRALFTAVVTGLLVSGAITEWMGLHFILGAFAFGLFLPKKDHSRVRAEVLQNVQKMGVSLLLPVYFVIAGIQVDLSQVDSRSLAEFGLILLVAMGGKFGGVFLAARSLKMDPKQSATLATLMNTRGLTELIILSAGLQLGLLDRGLYSLMVLMAVVTTAMAGPLLHVFHPRGGTPDDFEGSLSSPEALQASADSKRS